MTRSSGSVNSLKGRHVLIVEDEFYLAMDIKDGVERAGASVLGPSSDVEASLEIIERDRPDYAIVDINLGHGATFEIAEELECKKIPFLFLTGYDAASIPPGFAHIDRFEKPANVARIIEAIARLG